MKTYSRKGYKLELIKDVLRNRYLKDGEHFVKSHDWVLKELTAIDPQIVDWYYYKEDSYKVVYFEMGITKTRIVYL